MYKFIISTAITLLYSCSVCAETKTGITALLYSPETLLFIGAIGILTYYFLIYKFDRFAVTHGPEILTTVGILGCFLGIAIALLNFNSSDLTNSIPLLLEGIKTAFWASVFGIGGALLIKFKHLRRKEPIPQSQGATKSASIDDLVNSIYALQKGLIGKEEGTLLSQLKLLRQDSNDQLHKLCTAFSEFSSHMVENNQKAIVEALKQVIIDFNKNLTEQFGENFKQLNLAVEKLVTWQQQYKDELEKIKEIQVQTAADMRSASESFTTIVQKSENFSNIAEKLRDILESTSKHKDVLFRQEKALSELLLQMKDVTPQFTSKMSNMLIEVTLGVKQIQSETADIVKNFGTQTQSANAEMKNLLTEVISKSQQQLSEGLQENSKIIKEGVLTLDKALQKELNDALTTLGRQLASLSEKFVEDYLPLTERLREVVRLAAKV
jgi:multisubunit Na+/H+ antiporter MnhG subunit